MIAPRSLPIRVLPLPGEALDSWLAALARRSAVSARDLLIAAGPPFPSRADHAPDYTTFLTNEEAEQLARVTGTDAGLLHAMTLRRYDGYALALHDSRRVVRRVRLWGRGVGSRYCPQCLAEGDGRWALRWRLTWSIACIRHRTLLAHACPACGRWPHRRRFFTYDVAQHECSARKPGTTTICRADLTQSAVISLTSDNPVLSAQEWINGLLDQIEADVRDPRWRHAFTDLTAIATRSLLRAEPGDFSDCEPEVEHARQRYGNSALYAPIDAAVMAGPLDVLTAICLLAEYLDDQGAPIDYIRRRTLNGTGLLPETTWNDIRRRTGTRTEDRYRPPAVRRLLYQRMTGSNLYSPSQSLNLDTSPGSRTLPVILTEPLLAALDEHAADYLAARDISEPVAWSPPLALVDHLDLPGRAVSLPDTDQAVRLIQARRMSLIATAQALGTSLEYLRLAFELRCTQLKATHGSA